jgi:glucose dehydrogenase
MKPTLRDRRRFLKTGLALTAAAQAAPGARAVRRDPDRERHYGGNPGATRYSPLDQIKPSNVSNLKAPWVHSAGDAMERSATPIECESVVVDGVMYIQTAQLQTRGAIEFSRAVTFWQNPEDRANRIDAPDGGLQCLNAKTGDLKPGFARERSLDLVKGSDPDRTDQSGRLTSPRCVYEEIIVCGGEVGEGRMRRQGTSEALTGSPANSARSSTLCPNPANSPRHVGRRLVENGPCAGSVHDPAAARRNLQTPRPGAIRLGQPPTRGARVRRCRSPSRSRTS